ncbi:MAG TPA: hypothetical protein VK558_01785, partial [Patescibacteria group bacterium]|nr:hypothetical protein [Patescibacteria group bacterium]
MTKRNYFSWDTVTNWRPQPIPVPGMGIAWGCVDSATPLSRRAAVDDAAKKLPPKRTIAVFWNNLSIAHRFVIAAGCGLIVMIISVVSAVGWMQAEQMESDLDRLSRSEMTSLQALIINVMSHRAEDSDD